MAGLVPAIHVCLVAKEDVDGRDEHGHDECWLRHTNDGLAAWKSRCNT
jgi:hypothetical protein